MTRVVVTWASADRPIMLTVYGPEGGAAVPLLPKRALVLGVLAPVVRGGAAGVRALLKQARALAELEARSPRLRSASYVAKSNWRLPPPSTPPRPLEQSMPHA